jgi:hypothetical protein
MKQLSYKKALSQKLKIQLMLIAYELLIKDKLKVVTKLMKARF